jgi:hypothetical protein
MREDREIMQILRPGALERNRHSDRDARSRLVLENNVSVEKISKLGRAGSHIQD